MGIWEIIWLTVIAFSLLSFTYMSVKILYKGWEELKFMLSALETEYNIKNYNEK